MAVGRPVSKKFGNGASTRDERRAAFAHFARTVATATGSPWAFCAALLVTLIWAGFGPFVGYSDTWQLIINTSTTIATFLIVFLIQNTQNHEARVLQLKLDEL